MMQGAKEQRDRLSTIKDTIKKAHDAWKHNYDSFNEFRRFVFESSLTEEDKNLLITLSRPTLEFNVLEAYISRLLGEFSKQEPDYEITADDQRTADPLTMKVLEQHLRHLFADSDNSHLRYEMYKDLLSGGYSVAKVTTDYANAMSFHQVIKFERVYDPTLCGFDPMARMSHKGDGQFCFELFPMERSVFEAEYPDVPLNAMNFRRNFAGFSWSYLMDMQEIVLLAQYYEKKIKRVKIVQLANGQVITQKRYNEALKNWDGFEVPPAVVATRVTTQEVIIRTKLIENYILEEEETDFEHLPLVFFDGSSIVIKSPKNGNVRQVTRPYVYHAKGAQKLKNYAGISLANEIENIVQHKFIVKKEAIPKENEWLAAYKDIQKASVLVANAYYEENPDQPIPDPIREVAKMPAPPEILQAFTGSDATIQQVLGSYDASLGINNNQLSGVAIVEGATQSNSAAMPYVVGMMFGLQRLAEIYVNLFPKYITTPRTIPIMDSEGKKSYLPINQQGGVNMFFDANALNVIVKAGASFQVQKSRTIMMLKEMMGMSQLFAQFIAEKGLNFVLDNMEGRGIDQLKLMVEDWTKEYQQQKQQAMQMQQQEAMNDPARKRVELEGQKLMVEHQQYQNENALKSAQISVDKQKADTDQLLAMAEIGAKQDEQLVARDKAQAENTRSAVDMAIKVVDSKVKLHQADVKMRDIAHKHAASIAKHHHEKDRLQHEMDKSERESKRGKAESNME